MKFVARVVATVILGSLLFTQAFAEDSANSSSSTTTEPSAPNATGSSTAYLAPFIPTQATAAPAQTKTKTTSNGDTYPAVDLFAGYSYIRFRTDAGTKEAFNLHGFTGALAGNVNRWFSLVGDFGVYRIKDLPPSVSGSAYTFLFGPQFSRRRRALDAVRARAFRRSPPGGYSGFHHPHGLCFLSIDHFPRTLSPLLWAAVLTQISTSTSASAFFSLSIC